MSLTAVMQQLCLSSAQVEVRKYKLLAKSKPNLNYYVCTKRSNSGAGKCWKKLKCDSASHIFAEFSNIGDR